MHQGWWGGEENTASKASHEQVREWIFTCEETLQPTDSGEEAFASLVPLGSSRATSREAQTTLKPYTRDSLLSDIREVAICGSSLLIGRSAKNPKATRNNPTMNMTRSSTLWVTMKGGVRVTTGHM